jgi:hypothetical protein
VTADAPAATAGGVRVGVLGDPRRTLDSCVPLTVRAHPGQLSDLRVFHS